MVQRTCTDGFQAPQLRRFFIVSSQSYGELDGLLFRAIKVVNTQIKS